jgi:hypothetical protein
MNGPTAGVFAFVCLFSAALAGVSLHGRLPAMAAGAPAVALMRRGASMVAILAVIMLAAVTVYLKVEFDTANRDVRAFAFQVVDLDHALRRIGPPATPSRDLLFRYVARTMKDVWPDSRPHLGPEDIHAGRIFSDLETAIATLPAADPAVRDLEASARALLRDVGHARWTLDERAGRAMSPWMVSLLVIWLAVTFASLGVSAERSRLTLAILGLCAAALASAVFLAVEYADPYEGIIIVSSDPLQNAHFALSE